VSDPKNEAALKTLLAQFQILLMALGVIVDQDGYNNQLERAYDEIRDGVDRLETIVL
jgi:hypothetical protein